MIGLLFPAGTAASPAVFCKNLHVKLAKLPVIYVHLTLFRVILRSVKSKPTLPGSVILKLSVSALSKAVVT